MIDPSRLLESLTKLTLGLILLGTSVHASVTEDPPGAAGPAPAPAEGRVVLLGFDGADARTVRNLLAETPDRYPNFARLAAEGTFAPLEVVAPPESPVSWAAINTGQNPAKTGVPGFIRRSLDKGRPLPDFGHLTTEKAPIESFSNTPIPTWSAGKLAGVAGGAVFAVVLLLGMALLRGKKAVAFVFALLLGGGAGYVGFTMRQYLPSEVPFTGNPNQARSLWDFAADAGKRSIVIDAAQAFGMEETPGAKVLAGLGMPDARGGIGDWFVYTSNEDEFKRDGRKTSTAGMVFRVDEFEGGDGGTRTVESQIYGPKNFWLVDRLERELEAIETESKRPDVKLERSVELSQRKKQLEEELKPLRRASSLDGRTTVDLSVAIQGDRADVTIGTQTQSIAVGEWSDLLRADLRAQPAAQGARPDPRAPREDRAVLRAVRQRARHRPAAGPRSGSRCRRPSASPPSWPPTAGCTRPTAGRPPPCR